MELTGITRTVASLEKSRQFYEEILGFESDAFYAPTRWQSFKCQEGVFFAIGEAPRSTNEISFGVANIETLWLQVKDKVEVVNPLERTPWGTYRFVIKDPDGHLLAFGHKEAD
jgi:catechol 2,3-dioxygenase-like lactoylglutathione lyase family enzyme